MDRLILPDEHDIAIQKLLEKIPEKIAEGAEAAVLHIGAHMGEEVPFYIAKGFKNIYLVEANPDVADRLSDKFSGNSRVQVFNLAICDKTGIADLIVHETIKGSVESASILELKELGKIVPVFDSSKKYSVPSNTLDGFVLEHNLQSKIDLLTLDIQGAELLALTSGRNCLRDVSALICETNLIENYEGCPSEQEIDNFLENMGFKKILGVYHELYTRDDRFPAWGECLWIST